MSNNNIILAPNMLWLCIDHFHEETLSGRIYTTVHKDPIKFNDFSQLILFADQLFDDIAYPQSFEKKRTFKAEEESMDFTSKRKYYVIQSSEIISHRGKLQTFILSVEMRKHANWQGKLYTKNFEVINSFCDIIDLMHVLMQKI